MGLMEAGENSPVRCDDTHCTGRHAYPAEKKEKKTAQCKQPRLRFLFICLLSYGPGHVTKQAKSPFPPRPPPNQGFILLGEPFRVHAFTMCFLLIISLLKVRKSVVLVMFILSNHFGDSEGRTRVTEFLCTTISYNTGRKKKSSTKEPVSPAFICS